MSTSSSKSQSSSATTSNSEDNRIVNDNGGVVLGKDAALMINNELSDNALKLGQGLIDLAKGAGDLVLKQTELSNTNQQNATAAISSAINNNQLGTSQAFTNMIPILIAGVVAIIIIGMITKR